MLLKTWDIQHLSHKLCYWQPCRNIFEPMLTGEFNLFLFRLRAGSFSISWLTETCWEINEMSPVSILSNLCCGCLEQGGLSSSKLFFWSMVWNRSCTLSVGIFDIDVKLLDSYIEDDGVMVIANIMIPINFGWSLEYIFQFLFNYYINEARSVIYWNFLMRPDSRNKSCLSFSPWWRWL